ncbi:uncharacterized protein LOC143266091 [Megachile rotundata]|uniref:uncharacterized protein LOC143266091 n=1 Tax=Megachile rotundata TaxID=143995 RepID=UPI003FD147B7
MAPKGCILQANLNHSARAQDLFVHTLAEWQVGLAVAAEPYKVPEHPHWFGDDVGSVAIAWTTLPGSSVCELITRGRGFVAVNWDGTAVVGIYAPPSWTLARFEEFLDGMSACIARCLPRPLLVLGDFNSKAQAWGSPSTDARGEAVLDWAAANGLRLLNRGTVSTCVHPQGESIVDLSWATPSAAQRVSGWRAAEEVETLSDHLYIRMDVSATCRRLRAAPPRRWALKRLDEDALMVASLAAAWPEFPAGPVADVDEEADWFRVPPRPSPVPALPPEAATRCGEGRDPVWDVPHACGVPSGSHQGGQIPGV